MKNLSKHAKLCLGLLMLAALSFQGCVKNSCDLTFTYRLYTPVYMDEASFENAVVVETPRNLENPGKIFVKDDFLFVSEMGKGVHVFDNSNPASPQALSFIVAPGNYDINANCDKLYLDSSTDLLVFDIKNPATPAFVNRIKNVLPYMLSYRGYHADPSQGIVVEWRSDVMTGEYDCNTGVPHLWQMNAVDPATVNMGGDNTRTINPAVPGKAGSMSRFTVSENYLYVVAPNNLLVFDASNCSQPVKISETNIFTGGEAETIFAYESNLFIGSTNGLYIFDASNPSSPFHLSSFEHTTACDPVVVEGDYAYVTLRNGQDNPCGDGFANQLDVINIANPAAPYLARSFDMINPHGLGIDNKTLFLADGRDGLKVFDASTPEKVGNRLLHHFSHLQGYDVIPYENTLILVGEDGIAQYDYTDLNQLNILSNIPVVK